jgi:hypothetical protein
MTNNAENIPEIIDGPQGPLRKVGIGYYPLVDPEVERVDLQPDSAWDTAIQEIQGRVGILAQYLYQQCREEATQRNSQFCPDEPEIKVTDRICDVLGTLSDGLISLVQTEDLHRGVQRLKLTRTQTGFTARWVGADENAEIDLLALVQDRAAWQEIFSAEDLDVFGKILLDNVFDSQLSLWGFRRIDPPEPGEVLLELMPLSTEAGRSEAELFPGVEPTRDL